MGTEQLPGDEVVALERFAELGAIVLHFGDANREEVLERLDEDAARYRRSREHWIAAIAKQIARGTDELARTFGLCFAGKRDELTRENPPLDSLGPLRPVLTREVAPDAEAGAAAAPSPAELPAPIPPLRPALELPSYLREPAAPAPAAPDPAPAGPPMLSTEPIDLEHLRNLLVRGPTPFAGVTTPERLAELRDEGADPEADLQLESEGSPPGADETAMLPRAALRDHLATLPFAPRESPASVPQEGGGGDETMALPRAALRASLASSSDDFARSLRQVQIPDLSIDHYAALVVELEVKGPLPEVLRRHQVPTEASLEALHQEQQRRMLADPSLRARFEERRGHFRRYAARS